MYAARVRARSFKLLHVYIYTYLTFWLIGVLSPTLSATIFLEPLIYFSIILYFGKDKQVRNHEKYFGYKSNKIIGLIHLES